MARSRFTTPRSLPSALTIKPGSGDFFLAQQRKNEALVAIQLRNPTMTEKLVDAAKRGAKSLMGDPHYCPSKTISAFTNIIDSQLVTDAQRAMIIDELIKASRAARSVARAQAFGMVGVVGVAVIGSLGTTAWV